MSKEVFDNKPLPERNGNWTEDTFKYEIFVKDDLANRLIIEKRLISGPSSHHAAQALEDEAPKTERLDLEIEKDCRIELHLADNFKWRWNDVMAIGRGKESVPHYFNLRYWDDDKKDWVRPTEGKKYMAIRFFAELRRTGKDKDAINLNVLLEYSDTEMLPISIDPDIQNPKPNLTATA